MEWTIEFFLYLIIQIYRKTENYDSNHFFFLRLSQIYIVRSADSKEIYIWSETKHLNMNIRPPTPSWRTILDENWDTELDYIWFFQIFHVESEYIIFEIIHWANLKGRHF